MIASEHTGAEEENHGMPVPEPECPQCGCDKWRYVQIADQVVRKERMIKLGDRLLVARAVLAVAVIACFLLAPALSPVALVGLGALAVLVPVARGVQRAAYGTVTVVDVCESCGFVKVE